jgi:protein-L-isoaspartate(D-aspartate) O-methyltransferase
MNSNKELVKYLIAKQRLKTRKYIEAFKSIDRADFVLPAFKEEAYADYPLSIGFEQTISQPTTVAIMLELLAANAGQRILDIGTGSGWTTALLAHIVQPQGQVIGLEIIPELVKYGQTNLQKYPYYSAQIMTASSEIGMPGQTFDRILVSAAAPILPTTLIDQLATDAILVIPINNALHVYHKDTKHKIKEKVLFGFSFVPLIIRKT